MINIHRTPLRTLAAMLVGVAVVTLSTLAAHAPAQKQSSLALQNIRTENTAVFYAKSSPNCAWFREAVLPTGEKLAAARPNCAWFREAVLPTGDSKQMTENLQSVAAAL